MTLDDGILPAHLRAGAGARPGASASEIVPLDQEFLTVGHLYRGIEAGFRHLVDKIGADRLFIGPPRAQATRDFFNFPELIPVTDLDSAILAIETIVEEGEGARGDVANSHYGRFLRMHDELVAMQGADPAFEPTRNVLANPYTRVPADTEAFNLVDDPTSAAVCDLFDGCYEVLLLSLARFFAHTEESDEELHTLIDVAIDAMFVLMNRSVS